MLEYQSGDRITWHLDVTRYIRALAEAAPDRGERAVLEETVEATENVDEVEEDSVDGYYFTARERCEAVIYALGNYQDPVDQEHWLSAGVAPVLNGLVRGSGVCSPFG